MKVYIAVRFKGANDNKDHIEQMSTGLNAAGMEAFCFVRDIEHYQHVYDDPKQLWQDALREIKACDAMLIDVSDTPSGGRLVELGIAYALGLPIFVITKPGVPRKGFYDGVAAKVIKYTSYADITKALTPYSDKS